MHYKKEKRNKVDKCNICGKMDNLTWDHVPPKSCYNSGSIKCNELVAGIPIDKYQKEYQSGIRFRTLCGNCNNNLLGANYDTELYKITTWIHETFQTSLILPHKLYFQCNINKIVRSIVGHIIAAVAVSYPDGIIYNELRNFLLDETALPPQNHKLLFWIYPYSTIVINEGFVVKNVLDRDRIVEVPSGVCCMLSCYPIAYVLHDSAECCGLVDLFSLCTKNINDIIELPIDLKSYLYPKTSIYRHFLWPCNIGNDEYSVDLMLGNHEASIGIREKSSFK